MTYRLIADGSGLEEAALFLKDQPRIALDCEAAGFHRYSDRLCLVQLTTPLDTLLFDPLSANPADTLKGILEDPDVRVVMHGADFDLRLLHRDLGIRVRGLFDTQAAATLLGATSIGLASLLEEHLQLSLSKKHQRADWAKRPLAHELLEYAASDTQHLIPLCDILTERLRSVGREGWAEEEFRHLESIEWADEKTDPVTRVKGARHLPPREVAALRAAIQWRDRIARARDRAPFRVVGDPALLTIAIESPEELETLGAIKGMSPRLVESSGREILEELSRIRQLPENELQPYPRAARNGPGRLTPEEEASADELRALRAARAAELGLEKGVLLSNSQIQEIVRSAPQSVEALEALAGVRRWQIGILGPEIVRALSD